MAESEESIASIGRARLNAILGDSLFRDSSVLIAATLVGGGLNYAYQVLMGRLLGPEQYGVFGSLFGLFYMIMILSTGVAYCSTKSISTLSEGKHSGFLRGFALRVAVLTLVIFLMLAVLSPALAEFLKIPDCFLIIVVSAATLFGLLTAVNNGALRGLQRFVALGAVTIGSAAVKLVSGVGLVLLGFGLYGALGAVGVASLIALGGTTIYLRRLYLAKGDFKGFGGVYRYALPSVLVAFCLNIPANADVIVVKHLFTATQAGLYTSVTVLGKILIFLPIGISAAMFPKVCEKQSLGQETKDLLWRALTYTFSIVLLGALAYATMPNFIIKLFFGSPYTGGAHLVPWYGCMVAVFSLAVVMLNYSLARNETKFIKFFALLTAIEVALIFFLGVTMIRIIQIMLVANVVGAVVGWVVQAERTD